MQNPYFRWLLYRGRLEFPVENFSKFCYGKYGFTLAQAYLLKVNHLRLIWSYFGLDFIFHSTIFWYYKLGQVAKRSKWHFHNGRLVFRNLGMELFCFGRLYDFSTSYLVPVSASGACSSYQSALPVPCTVSSSLFLAEQSDYELGYLKVGRKEDL